MGIMGVGSHLPLYDVISGKTILLAKTVAQEDTYSADDHSQIMDGSKWTNYLETTMANNPDLDATSATHKLLLQAQQELLNCLLAAKTDHSHPLLRTLRKLDAFQDPTDSLIRVGGRLAKSQMTFGRKYPILIPQNDMGNALIGYIHDKEACHQGRQITMSNLHQQGYFPMGARKRISNLLHHCEICRRHRAQPMQQKMADLPEHRLLETPPFYHSGIDVFGPFIIKEGRTTRANTGTRKIWCLLFTCLYSRGVHVETLDHMSTDSFKMAFQRFQDLRGECVYLRSDHSSNFIGAYNEQLPPNEEKAANDTVQEVQNRWTQEGKVWEFNPPKASHMGGVWER